MTATSWESGHPQLDAPYFAEYLSLIAGRGVAHFDESFSYSRFAASADERQRRYLTSLVASAEAEGRTAVLSFCRSTARSGTIRSYFPDALHVFQKRSPAGQFSSCWNQFTRRSNPYFVAVHYLIVASAPAGPFALLRATLEIPDLHGQSFEEQYAVCVRLATDRGQEQAFRVFGHIYEYCRLHSEKHCDIVLDVDALGMDADYRHGAEDRLQRLSGLAVTFDNARPVPPAASLNIDVERLVREASGWALNHLSDP